MCRARGMCVREERMLLEHIQFFRPELGIVLPFSAPQWFPALREVRAFSSTSRCRPGTLPSQSWCVSALVKLQSRHGFFSINKNLRRKIDSTSHLQCLFAEQAFRRRASSRPAGEATG